MVYLNGFPNVSVQVEKAKEEDASNKDKKDKKKAEEEASASETVASPEKPIGLLVRLKDGSFRLFYHEAALKEGSKTDVQFTIAHIDLGLRQQAKNIWRSPLSPPLPTPRPP